MSRTYDQHYRTPKLFGKAHAPVLAYFDTQLRDGAVLDLGCGQGRNAIPLVHMGFSVTGVDLSAVGIAQMVADAPSGPGTLTAKVADVYEVQQFAPFRYILLDSMLHFAAKDRHKEMGLLHNIASGMAPTARLVVCMPDVEQKTRFLFSAVEPMLQSLQDERFPYVFEQPALKKGQAPHRSVSEYRMLVFSKSA